MIPMSSSLMAMAATAEGREVYLRNRHDRPEQDDADDDECDLGAGGHGVVAEAGSKEHQAGETQSEEDGGGENGLEGEAGRDNRDVHCRRGRKSEKS